MIKVVEVISDTNIGGAGRLLVNKIKNSNKDFFKYTVILPKESDLVFPLREIGAEIIEIDGCKNQSLDFKGIFELYKIIKGVSPDILNSHACISSRIVGKIAGVNANIYTRHCDFPVKKIFTVPMINKFLKETNDFLSDGIIAVSNSAKRNLLLLGAPNEKIKVIVNGAEAIPSFNDEIKKKIKAGLNIPADAIVVGIFARLEVYKDHKTFLRAAKLLKKNKNIYFIIVGSGSLEHELKEYTKKLGINERVIFSGFVDDVSEIMNITDINVNCSIGTETSSLALSEGMSLGIPAIASDYAGNKYIVKNRVNGLIFRQRDHVDLAKKILFLVKNKSVYDEFSINARKRFLSELNAKNMTDKTERYYMYLLHKKGIFKDCL